MAITNLSNPFYGTFALGVEEVVAERGRYILLGSTAESASRESDLVGNFLSRRVEGLIVIPAGEPAPRRWVRRLGSVPIVVAARELPDADVDTVLMDDLSTGRRLTEDLLQQGHRRIAFIGNIVTVSAHRHRYEGFESTMRNGGAAVDKRLVRGVTADVEDARTHARSFLDLAHPPTAIISANNRISVGVLAEFRRRLDAGASADELPLLAAFDDLELAGLLRVPVRVYGSDPRELGRTAARLLFERLDGDADGPRRHLIVGDRMVSTS
ncbi:substrate-binding domain-containing protein [Naasia lichenicola]|uniref:substrate-binding domain-containing protein n=1 Tax=Naasia lichenicola TaxID=2565933 RepID=UPI003F69DF77